VTLVDGNVLIYATDADFERFPGLDRINPLQ
jgi:hypothetical protein